MRPDQDLQFLVRCNNAELKALCDLLTHDENGELRLSEQLTNSDSYLTCYPDNMKGMWQDIAMELQKFGGNSILNVFRHGRGPSYESIVYDACKKMGVKDIGDHDPVALMEQKLLHHLTDKVLDEMTEAQIKELMSELHIKKRSYTKQAVIGALLLARQFNQRLYISIIDYIIQVVTNLFVGKGVMNAGMGLVRKADDVVKHCGWFLLGGWTMWELASPAYRVTVPAVMQVAYLRLKYNSILIQ